MGETLKFKVLDGWLISNRCFKFEFKDFIPKTTAPS